MTGLEYFLFIILEVVFLKSFFLGSSFNFYLYFKYGKKYKKNYDNWMKNIPKSEDFKNKEN